MPEQNDHKSQISTVQEFLQSSIEPKPKVDLGHVEIPKLPKFDFAANQIEAKSKFVTNLLLRSGVFIICMVVSAIFLVLPLISQGADVVPINPNPSNEQLTVTSVKSPFYLLHNGSIFYSTNNNGTHTLNLGQSVTTGEVEIGTYLDLGFTKINSTNRSKYTINRNFTSPTFKTNLNQYQDRKTGEYELTLNSSPDYLRVYNNEVLIYETKGSNNLCKFKFETKVITCPYDYQKSQTLNYSLRTSDKFGNFSPTFTIQTAIVPTNDFSCEILKSNAPKISCYGSKPGIIELNSQSIDYKAFTRVILPIPLSNGPNKITTKMTDIHGIVVPIDLNYDFDQSQLVVNLKTSNSAIVATSSKNISSIVARLSLKQTANSQSTSDLELSKEVTILNSTIAKGASTEIITNSISIPKSMITLPKFKLSNLELEFQDESSNIVIKQCNSEMKVEEDTYNIEFVCNN